MEGVIISEISKVCFNYFRIQKNSKKIGGSLEKLGEPGATITINDVIVNITSVTVNDDRLVTIRETFDMLKISAGSVRTVIKDQMKTSCICVGWIPDLRRPNIVEVCSCGNLALRKRV
jgi:hypothetical protein